MSSPSVQNWRQIHISTQRHNECVYYNRTAETKIQKNWQTEMCENFLLWDKNSLLPQTKSKKSTINFAIFPPRVSIILIYSIVYQWALEAEKWLRDSHQ